MPFSSRERSFPSQNTLASYLLSACGGVAAALCWRSRGASPAGGVALVLAACASASVLPSSLARALLAAAVGYAAVRRARVVGLTGGIACGKSTVARAFAAGGATVLDLDALAREVVVAGSPAWRDLVRHFGAAAVLEGGGGGAGDAPLDRAALRAIIAHDPAARAFVNAATHPRIFALLLRRVAWHRWCLGRAVVVEAPLLFESGLLLRALCAPIVCVTAGEGGGGDADGGAALQAARVAQRDGSPMHVARALVAAQMPVARKAALSDHVIANGAAQSLADVDAAASRLWRDTLRAL